MVRFWRRKSNSEKSEKKKTANDREATKMKYFEVERPSGDGRCSDDSCPCPYPGTHIPRGSGYLFIPQSLVDFRRDARSIKECQEKCLKIQEKMGGIHIWGPGSIVPIMCCEQAAKLRNLDLDVAAADAKYWWKTGWVPLRATPPSSKK